MCLLYTSNVGSISGKGSLRWERSSKPFILPIYTGAHSHQFYLERLPKKMNPFIDTVSKL